MNLFSLTIIIFLGLVIGSFLNVVIYRVPLILAGCKNIGLCYPKSQCPKCHNILKKKHNIPLLSFIIYRGHCAYCHGKISWRYPCVEMSLCIVYVLGWYVFQNQPYELLGYLTLVSFLMALSCIDLDTKMLPDCLTLPLIVLGIFFNINEGFVSIGESVIGGIGGFIFFTLFSYIIGWRKGSPALGGGDVKLFAAIGAWFGLISLPYIAFTASLLTLITLAFLTLINSQKISIRVPFGPGISLATLIYLTFIYSNFFEWMNVFNFI
ncbi:prepilin peptidase [Yersinia enterocolitica]|nr:prepilin peptidase [Yersinia enterocolitica]